MKKNFKYYAIAWIIVVLLFNIVLFTVSANTVGIGNLKASFWIAYATIMISFVGHLFCTKMAFDGDSTKLFYNLPLIDVSFLGSVANCVVGLVFIVLNFIPNWITVIVCALILGADAMLILKAKATADIIERKDEEIKQKTSFIKGLTTESDIQMSLAATKEEKDGFKKIHEALRYSDPVSSPALETIEREIRTSFTLLKSSYSQEIVEKTLRLIEARNKSCKLNK